MCKAEGGIKEYWEQKNAKSLDGLPGLSSAPSAGFCPHGYNINLWTSSPPFGEKDMGKLTHIRGYVDAKFMAGMAMGGLFATICYIIFQHAQPRFSLLSY